MSDLAKKYWFGILILLIVGVGNKGYAQSYSSQKNQQKISPILHQKANSGNPVDFIVVMMDQANLKEAKKIKNKIDKGQFVLNQLKKLAQSSQADICSYLDQEGISYESFFVFNGLALKGNLDLIYKLAARKDVKSLMYDPWIKFDEPAIFTREKEVLDFRADIDWNIERINAPRVWALGYKGEGVVVGGQDTGYEWNNPFIIEKYRGWMSTNVDHNYHWHDAIHEINPLHGDPDQTPGRNPCGLNSIVPCDDNNHGTHTMGTMVGSHADGPQFGVAPAAKWIACRNMERGWGKPSTYIECFEWFMAPTNVYGENPRVDQAPHVVNNSWGCPLIEGCDEANRLLMNKVVDAVKASGIVVVSSAGNSGRGGCSTVSDPAAYYESSFTVGATRFEGDSIADFSSRGPVLRDGSGRLKPNVVAPGVGVRSVGRNNQLLSWQGTSMAAPHVAGLVALMISANPDLAGDVETIESILEKTSIPKISEEGCGGLPADEIPNHVYGYGRIDAMAAIQSALLISDSKGQVATKPRLNLYPNPVVESFSIESNKISGTVQFYLFNQLGQKVYATSLNLEPLTPVTIQLGLTPGLYYYEVNQGDEKWSGRLVAQ